MLSVKQWKTSFYLELHNNIWIYPDEDCSAAIENIDTIWKPMY